jgi:DNA-3-methyladenine glycosylase
MARPRRLPRSFFGRSTLLVAHELLGQRLVRIDRGRRLSGWIIEAEAYIGQADLACHAHSGRTERNRVMWGEPGHAYVYFTYGMHWCLNVVTESTGRPAAVLLRALAPSEGLATMRRRRALHAGTRSGEALPARHRDCVSGAMPERSSRIAQSKG